jgi:hypothetical protein
VVGRVVGSALGHGRKFVTKRLKFGPRKPDILVRAWLTRGFFAHMDVPENLDYFLKDLLAEESAPVQLDDEDRAFIDRILKSITTGSKGIFVVLHPNDRMQYMLLNTNRAGAIALLARVMQRTAEALEADLD